MEMLSILAQRAVCLLLMDPPRVRIRHDAPARMGAAADYLVERLECSPQQASLAESKMLPNLAASLDSATAALAPKVPDSLSAVEPLVKPVLESVIKADLERFETYALDVMEGRVSL